MQALKAMVPLFKLRTVALLVVVALVSAIAAGQGEVWNLPSLAILTIAGALACAGSGALNHYLDRDIDPIQVRTSRRPLPAGQVKPEIAMFLGLSMIGIALVLSWQLNRIVPLFIGLGALTYVVIYTCWLKRRTTQNIVIGGLAGSWAAMAGWFTISHEISSLPILLALIVFLWTPVHFWSFALAHISDYRRTALPMLPVKVGERKAAQQIFIYATLSVVASGALLFVGPLRTIYQISWLILSAIFIFSNLRLLKQPSPARAWSNFKLSGLYLLGLFLAVGLDIVLR